MTENLLWLLTVLGIATLAIGYTFGWSIGKAWNYFTKDKDGRGAGVGIALFLGIGIVLALGLGTCSTARADDLPSIEGKWFGYGEVFLGLDNTFDLSPQCHEGPHSDRLTSNGGLILNIFESDDRRFTTNFKYTHHSCAFNKDNESYDAFGLEAKLRFDFPWSK